MDDLKPELTRQTRRELTRRAHHIRNRRVLITVISVLVTAALCAAYVWADIRDLVPGVLTNAPVSVQNQQYDGRLISASTALTANADTSKAIDKQKAAKLIDTLRSAEGVGSNISVVIAQADGTVAAEYAASATREPASTMKTLTALAAASSLDMGATLATQTFLLQNGGTNTVVLKGNGDMLLSAGESDSSHVNGRAGLLTLAKSTAQALKQRGISSITLGYDDSLFGTDRTPKNIEENNPDNLYYTPVSSMAIDGGRQWNGAAPSDPDVFETYPTLSQTTATDVVSTFRTLLKQQGITIADGNAAQTSVPSDRTPIAQVESAPLSSVMAFMLRHSDNTLAEEFGRLLALHTKQGNSPTAATAAVRAQLEKLGVDVTGLTMADCSGLTPGSTLTATTLVQVQERNLQVGGAVAAAEGLAIPGLVGTAANRLGSAQAAGLTRVKTGNLQAVSSMTGNVSREQGGVAAFAVIVNNPQDFTATRSAIDTFVAGLTAL